MKEATKQRIVGTVVLLALGLIFLPLVFDGEGSYEAPVASRIPEPPTVPILPEPEPTRPQILADQLPDAASAEQATAEQAEVAESQLESPVEPQAEDGSEPESAVQVVESAPDFEREVPQFDANGMPEAWVVRLGTFANAGNADNLVARLQAAGFKAYTRRVNNADSDEMTAVFVGPWLQRQLVEDYRQQLQQQFQLAGMIVRYEIDPL